ncbi:MAG: substrate-binding domain-containing protein [Acidobacteria bacterium]|jgi:simple sugar transport system substrate-binding protein|nr:substrate-binding domain-containing protein [Acidobacteriota bacterium]
MKRKITVLISAAALAVAGVIPALSAGASGNGIPAKVSIAFLGGAPTDSFWTVVHNGVNVAAASIKSLGGSVQWYGFQNYNNFCPDAGTLTKTIEAAHPTVAVIPNWCPQTQTQYIKAMEAAGTIVVEDNNGATWKQDGAINYVGEDNTSVGLKAGTTFIKDGYKNVVCVNSLPGTITAEQVCSGLKTNVTKGGGKYTELDLPSSAHDNPSSVEAAVKGYLLAHTAVTGVMTIGPQDADAAAAGISSAGLTSKVGLGSWDLSTNILNRIIAGKQLFTIDQEPYLQGFYGIMVGFQYAKYGVIPSAVIPTGPNVVNASNAKLTLAGAALNLR